MHLIPESGYLFSKAMANPGFISVTDIKDIYLPMGFSNFKIEGRGTGKCTDSGIPAVLYDKTRIPDSCQRKDISG